MSEKAGKRARQCERIKEFLRSNGVDTTTLKTPLDVLNELRIFGGLIPLNYRYLDVVRNKQINRLIGAASAKIPDMELRRKSNQLAKEHNEIIERALPAKIVKLRPRPPSPAGATVVEGVSVKSDEFLQTRAWRTLRYAVLRRFGRQCQCCGSADGIMHVDHIKPRHSFPELALVESNLQVLCEDCNLGKGAWDDTDWRDQIS